MHRPVMLAIDPQPVEVTIYSDRTQSRPTSSRSINMRVISVPDLQLSVPADYSGLTRISSFPLVAGQLQA
jgi:hypothetical protein